MGSACCGAQHTAVEPGDVSTQPETDKKPDNADTKKGTPAVTEAGKRRISVDIGQPKERSDLQSPIHTDANSAPTEKHDSLAGRRKRRNSVPKEELQAECAAAVVKHGNDLGGEHLKDDPMMQRSPSPTKLPPLAGASTPDLPQITDPNIVGSGGLKPKGFGRRRASVPSNELALECARATALNPEAVESIKNPESPNSTAAADEEAPKDPPAPGKRNRRASITAEQAAAEAARAVALNAEAVKDVETADASAADAESPKGPPNKGRRRKNSVPADILAADCAQAIALSAEAADETATADASSIDTEAKSE